MAQQQNGLSTLAPLDASQVRAGFQQKCAFNSCTMRGKCMAEAMRSDGLGETRDLAEPLAGLFHGVFGDGSLG